MHPHDHDLGLAHDLERLMRQAGNRRGALRWLIGGAGGLAGLGLVGCGGGGDAGSASSSSSSGSSSSGSSGSSGSTSTTCSVIPEETAGPYPGDGSNTANGSIANALALSGIVRSDIRSSIAGASGVATGVPLQVIIELVNTNSSCADLSGYAIYLWHCDAQGGYSMYSDGLTEEVDDPSIAATLKHDDCSAQECVDTLIAAALDGGGSDNVTAILVRCH